MQAVIFDMDGTLFDTERLYGEAWVKAGITRELYLTLIGRSAVNITQILKDNGYDPDEIRGRKNRYTEELLQSRGVVIKDGAREALQWLSDHNMPAAVATSSYIEVAERYLAETGFRPYFTKVISGSALEHGKPEPDIFLFAAKELGVAPDECVVVEDGYNGVRAGKAAGMNTVMVPDLVAPDDEMRSLADIIMDSLSELPEYLESLI